MQCFKKKEDELCLLIVNEISLVGSKTFINCRL